MRTTLTTLALALTVLVQAGGTFSLIEINPLRGVQNSIFSFPDSSKAVYGAGELSGFAELNGKMYFSAQNAYERDALWSTDGTQEGTVLVKQINPAGSSQIGNIVKAGNRILFMAADNNNFEFDLWSSDGTENGTIKVADLNQFSNTGLNHENIALINNRLLFCTSERLMITDGTTMGTDSLLYITSYSQGLGYCELNNKVYFMLPKSNGHQELWRTDGTKKGTEMVTDVTATDSLTGISQMVAFNGRLYIIAGKNWSGPDLYTFDGNPGGQIQQIMLAPGSHSYPSGLTLYNGALYFTASTMTSANVFRVVAGNINPQALIPDAAMSYVSNISFTNNSIYFNSENQQEIHRIDLVNLSHTTTRLKGGAYLPYYFDGRGLLAGLGGMVYFAAYDSVTGNQVLMTANKDLQNMAELMPPGANTGHPFNFITGCGTADIFDFKVWGNKLLLPANFNDAGRELWIYEPAGLASGVKETNKVNTFTLFPNPANNGVTVQTTRNDYCQQYIQIVDITGAVAIQATINNDITFINLSSLATGNYCATVVENGEAISTQKLVVAK